ncbi:hypothetical protein ACFQZC_21230 [Streptacidiphilus monticola]
MAARLTRIGSWNSQAPRSTRVPPSAGAVPTSGSSTRARPSASVSGRPVTAGSSLSIAAEFSNGCPTADIPQAPAQSCVPCPVAAVKASAVP